LEKPSVLVQNRRKYKLSNSIKTEGFSRKTFCFFLKKTEKKLNRTEGNTRSPKGHSDPDLSSVRSEIR
jgi:hypothetical protein